MRTLLITIIFFPVVCFSQKIAEKKVDEFTKSSIIRTSWETLTKVDGLSMKGLTTYLRFSKINDVLYLDLKAMDGSVLSVPDGNNIMLMFQNDSIVTIKNQHYEVACMGCGAIGLVGSSAYGIQLNNTISDSLLETLKKNQLKKIRIYFRDGYLEDDVKEKHAKIIIKLAELF